MLGAMLALSGLAVGCSTSEEDRVKDTMHTWMADFAHGRGPQACARLTDAGRTDFMQDRPIGEDCEAAVRRLGGALTAEYRETFLSIKVRHVDVRGKRALIHNRDLEFPDELKVLAGDVGRPTVLVHVNERWLIDDLAG